VVALSTCALLPPGGFGAIFAAHQIGSQPSEPGEQTFPVDPSPEGELSMAEGTLLKIDLEQQVLWLKQSDGTVMQFAYTPQTAVEGAGDTTEGLSGQEGTPLRIHYEVIGGVNTALRIEVLPIRS
jgi:hypothetical protein